MSEKISRPSPRRAKRARARNLARQRRRQTIMENRANVAQKHAFFRRRFPSYNEERWTHRALAWLFSSRSPVAKLTTVVVIAVVVFFMSSYVFAGRIFPNVYAMSQPVGGLRPEEAQTAILEEWFAQVRIDITVNGEPLDRVGPEELGLAVDAPAMAAAAKAAGLAGIPFGINIEPIVTVSHGRAQSLMLDLTEEIYQQQYEAGYKWAGDRLVTVAGQRGTHLNISESLERLKRDASAIVTDGRFELSTITLNPTVFDSAPFLDEAIVFLSAGITLSAYDPFKDERVFFVVDETEATAWLMAGQNGLEVRKDKFHEYIKNINENHEKLIASGRYIDKLLATETLQEALDTSNTYITLRLNYLPQPYTIAPGDTGHSIGRRKGIPPNLILDANPSVQWNALTVGQIVQIPSRDVMTPAEPVPHKRIIVDLESQWLVYFENGQPIGNWGISSGRETAPTYPGIFQVLTHRELSYGSSYALCDVAFTNCSQWDMFWFMGIYEVVPGLMNGFHGAVKLPNGNYLGGGEVWEPSTYGCIMSENELAKQLYDWAEEGTMVEIISKDFPPESELAQYALDFIATIDTNWRYY